MPSLITRRKKGHPYLYWVRSARVNGHPRIVEQVYLGPRDRVLQRIHDVFTTGSAAAPPELQRVQLTEFGASAVFWTLVQELGVVDLINAVVPPPPLGKRTSLSVGHYLVLAALNRAIAPHSKRAFADWYTTTVGSRLWPVSAVALTSQRFWDHMQPVTPVHIQQIQQALGRRLAQQFTLDRQVLIYDTTNYSTFVSTFNARATLPQRGRNKQRRADLRQLSLAVVLDEPSGLPLYHRCYEGNLTDVQALPLLVEELRTVVDTPKAGSDAGALRRCTLILDVTVHGF